MLREVKIEDKAKVAALKGAAVRVFALGLVCGGILSGAFFFLV